MVRAILINPRYLGRQVAGRQRRHDVLLNARDPALGTISRQVRQSPDAWSWSEQSSWPALVPQDLFERVNARITTTAGTGRRKPRSQPGQYVLAGAIRCSHCGKAMFGNTAKSKAYYRCVATRPDYATPSVPGHPPTYMVREERILSAVDAWLGLLTDAEHIEDTVAAIVGADKAGDPEPVELARARRKCGRLELELDRVLAAIRAGMDPTLAAGQTRKIQAEIAGFRSTIRALEQSSPAREPLAEGDVRQALTTAGGLVAVLASADRADRAALYRALGLTLRYEKQAPTGEERIHVRLELCRGSKPEAQDPEPSPALRLELRSGGGGI